MAIKKGLIAALTAGCVASAVALHDVSVYYGLHQAEKARRESVRRAMIYKSGMTTTSPFPPEYEPQTPRSLRQEEQKIIEKKSGLLGKSILLRYFMRDPRASEIGQYDPLLKDPGTTDSYLYQPPAFI